MRIHIDKLSADLHDNAVDKGFWDPLKVNYEQGYEFVFYAKQLAMIHSEVTEVLEAMRKNKGEEQVVEELADILIRVFDFFD